MIQYIIKNNNYFQCNQTIVHYHIHELLSLSDPHFGEIHNQPQFKYIFPLAKLESSSDSRLGCILL